MRGNVVVRAVVVVVLRAAPCPVAASVLLRLWRLSVAVAEEACVEDDAVVEVLSVAFLSRDEERRAVSLACRSAAMR